MNYSKPEIVELGNAADLIEGFKLTSGDAASLTNPTDPDCELDD